ncbi:MAG: hypothetical protein WD794_02820 [Mycobacteriales bacterium]
MIDDQNVHLVGHAAFDKDVPKHETLVDPALYAGQLVAERNRRQREGHAHAVLGEALVYRGEPSAEHDPDDDAHSQSQKSRWERDARVHVILRPLKYEYQRDAQGRPATLYDGSRMVTGKREKGGVDVLCALAAVREAAGDPHLEGCSARKRVTCPGPQPTSATLPAPASSAKAVSRARSKGLRSSSSPSSLS